MTSGHSTALGRQNGCGGSTWRRGGADRCRADTIPLTSSGTSWSLWAAATGVSASRTSGASISVRTLTCGAYTLPHLSHRYVVVVPTEARNILPSAVAHVDASRVLSVHHGRSRWEPIYVRATAVQPWYVASPGPPFSPADAP